MTSPERSRIMRAVKGRNTSPELMVRRLVHGMGYRFRLHRSDLPGKPDLAFPSLRAVVFVNGCFWHGHDCKRGARVPKTNTTYWRTKVARNVARDADHARRLKAEGWRVLVLWECGLKDKTKLARQIRRFLGARESSI